MATRFGRRHAGRIKRELVVNFIRCEQPRCDGIIQIYQMTGTTKKGKCKRCRTEITVRA